MDTQTRHALKGDKFAQATKTSVNWVSGHRSNVMQWAISAAVVLVVGVALIVLWNVRETAAEAALGSALDTYAAPLAMPGQPAQSGVYATSADRSKAANQQFQAVTDKYGWLPEGAKARYFTGVTDQELGQTSAAETELKKVAGSWNRNLANLAKVALASIYHQTNRDQQAIDLYNEIIAKPSDTVTAGTAQLDLADLYAATGKQDQARALWAKLKDSDKDGAAGSIAAQKLTGKE
ncbi:coatomer subunit epsilon [Telmatobacter sp. DSM 110680]|uniref:Coatomer subunit epsilon n=1 Tax=Telmatobacter sp. DSM 110680 TaxID=3036704 RepID=A0AAU7DN25_9BACT